MIINRKEFQEILNEFSKSAPKKSSYDKKNRAMYVGPYTGGQCVVAMKSNDLVIRCFLNRKGHADPEERIWVDIDMVKSIVSGKCGDGDSVQITTNDGLVEVDCDSIKTKIFPIKEMEGIFKIGKRKWQDKFNDIGSTELHNSMSYVITSLCEEKERTNVFGVRFNFEKGEIVCADHCSVKTSRIKNIEEEAITIFPGAAKSLARVSKIMQKRGVVCEMAMEAKKKPEWIAFSFDDPGSTWVIQSKITKDEYADYSSIEPKEPFEISVGADALKRRIAHLQKMKLGSVRIRIIRDSKIIDMEASNGTENVFIDLKVDKNGYEKDDEYKVSFDPKLLQNALNGASGKQAISLSFEEQDSSCPAKIELENGNSTILAVMRMD